MVRMSISHNSEKFPLERCVVFKILSKNVGGEKFRTHYDSLAHKFCHSEICMSYKRIEDFIVSY